MNGHVGRYVGLMAELDVSMPKNHGLSLHVFGRGSDMEVRYFENTTSPRTMSLKDQ